jgi:sugar O-acyltransferase (sialic acid O-acetyltransferase NeuD family)
MVNKTGKVVIVGAGETAELAYEYFTHDSPLEVAGFSVEQKYLDRKELFGLPVAPFEEVEKTFPPAGYQVFVAVSFVQLNRPRTRLYLEAKRKGYTAASYVSSRAFVWRNVEIGENCFILEHNVLQYHVKIGNNVVLWSGNHIGHRTVIRDHCFISSHVVVSGYCEVGESCFMGVNSTVGDKVKIERDCIIGAGALILKNTEPGKVYRGNASVPWHIGSLVVANVKEP